jgi:hypothetical protein
VFSLVQLMNSIKPGAVILGSTHRHARPTALRDVLEILRFIPAVPMRAWQFSNRIETGADVWSRGFR